MSARQYDCKPNQEIYSKWLLDDTLKFYNSFLKANQRKHTMAAQAFSILRCISVKISNHCFRVKSTFTSAPLVTDLTLQSSHYWDAIHVIRSTDPLMAIVGPARWVNQTSWRHGLLACLLSHGAHSCQPRALEPWASTQIRCTFLFHNSMFEWLSPKQGKRWGCRYVLS